MKRSKLTQLREALEAQRDRPVEEVEVRRTEDGWLAVVTVSGRKNPWYCTYEGDEPSTQEVLGHYRYGGVTRCGVTR